VGVLLLACAAAVGAGAQTFTTLINFSGTDGSAPFAALVQGTDGNLYGTTENGGASGQGTVFRLTPTTLTTIYSFCAQSGCADGSQPQAALVLGSDGNFYGTTMFGGAISSFCVSGCGTVFKITPAGLLTTLYSFCVVSSCRDGSDPVAGLVQGTDGNFYGTTPTGGTYSQGTVFKITPGGTLTTLYRFCSTPPCTDGSAPLTALIQATNGVFYGTTSAGGLTNNGDVFAITSTGALTVIHSFDVSDGQDPASPLLQAVNGSLYGMTEDGGTSSPPCDFDCGTIFELSPPKSFKNLVNFDGPNGSDPVYSGLIQGSDGNLYGTTWGGGASSEGTIFKMTLGGELTTVYSFCPPADCGDGVGFNSIMQSTNGILYGTTVSGGTSNDGTLFSLDAGLRRFVQAVPTTGTAGSTVMILGNELTGATGVTFNGSAAKFKVVSSTEILATVPSGATTGRITVTGPAGSLSTVFPFQLR
jgi:uncharacterized repeat protein (TIGR03803 family)